MLNRLRSGGHDVLHGDGDSNLTIHDLEQNTSPTGGVQPFERPDQFGEGSRDNLDRSSRFKPGSEIQEAGFVGLLDETFDQPDRTWRRMFALHYERPDSDRAVYGTPAIAGQIKRNEHVARKEWRAFEYQAPRVSHGTILPRQERMKPL